MPAWPCIENFYSWKIFNEKRTVTQKIIDRLASWKYPDVFFSTLLIILVFLILLWKKPKWLFSFKETTENKALLFIRILFGIIMIVHGIPEIIGGLSSWLSLGQTLANFGIYSHPIAWGYFAAATETLGGLLLLMGLLSRPVACMLCFNMLVATSKHLFLGQGIDSAIHPLSLLAIFIFLAISGPGKYSVDYKLSLKNNNS